MATQRAIGVQLRRIRAAGDIDAPSASNREAGIPVKSAPVAGPVGTSARLGHRRVEVRLNQDRRTKPGHHASNW